MLMMFDNKLEMVAKNAMTGWQQVTLESRRLREGQHAQEEMKKRLREQASQNMKKTMMSFLQVGNRC